MKKLLLALGIILIMATQSYAATWSYKIKQVQKNGDNVVIIVQLLADGVIYGGREVVLDYGTIKTLSKVQIKTLINNQIANMAIESSEEYFIKSQIPVDIETTLP